MITRRVIHSGQFKLESLSYQETEKAIRSIFNDGHYNGTIKVTQVKKLMPFNDEKYLRDNIIFDFINNNSRNVFKKYNFLWKHFKKEPFLGTYLYSY